MSEIPPAPLQEEPEWDDLPWVQRRNEWSYDHPDATYLAASAVGWLIVLVPQVVGALLGPWAMYASYAYAAFIYCATGLLKPRKFLRPFVVASVLLAAALVVSACVTVNSRHAAPAAAPYSPPPEGFPPPDKGANPPPAFP